MRALMAALVIGVLVGMAAAPIYTSNAAAYLMYQGYKSEALGVASGAAVIGFAVGAAHVAAEAGLMTLAAGLVFLGAFGPIVFLA